MYSDFLTFKLDLTSALLIERANVAYREHWDLDVRALRVLRTVCAEPDTTQGGVAAYTGREDLAIQGPCRPEARGLMRRTTHPSDRRSVMLRATARGLEVARASEVLGSALEVELAKALSASERRTLERLLDKLHDLLSAGSAGAPD